MFKFRELTHIHMCCVISVKNENTGKSLFIPDHAFAPLCTHIIIHTRALLINFRAVPIRSSALHSVGDGITGRMIANVNERKQYQGLHTENVR